jgi:transposase
MEHREIARIAGVSVKTVTRYLQEYQKGGLALCQQLHFHQPQSELDQHAAALTDYFRQHPPVSVKQAMQIITERTGLKRKETQVRVFLQRIGLKRLTVAPLPGKVDADKIQEQQSFHDQKLQPRLQEAQHGHRAVWFVDASHFVHGFFFAWCGVFNGYSCARPVVASGSMFWAHSMP